MRVLWVLLALACAGCAHDYYSGAFDPVRTARGDIFVDKITLPNGETLFREMIVIDAPPWRVLNLATDIESAPLVKPWFARVEVLSRSGDTMEIRFSVKPNGPFVVPPTTVHARLDAPAMEISSTAYENELVRSIEVVDKFEPYGDGSQTLMTEYSTFSLKAWWGGLAFLGTEGQIAEGLRNIRQVVKLPKYAHSTMALSPGSQVRVAMPGFSAVGVSRELAWTLSRTFAQQLMHKPEWKLITQDEVVALLDYAKKRQLAGCRADDGCVLDLGRALSAPKIVDASIGKVGSAFVLSASLVNVADGSVEQRATEQAASESGLLAAVQKLALQFTTSRQ